MMHDNKITVIIPVFNCQFIDQAIKSVLAQSYNNYEIFVVDDGSTDDTRDTVCRFRDLHPDKISYYYQNQQGPAAARNAGIRKSFSEYIAFLDADDIWMHDKLEKQIYKFQQDTDVGFVYCDNYFIDKAGQIIEDYVRKVKLVEGDILLDFFMDFFLITSGIILKRSCLKKTGLFDKNLEVGEDFDFFLRLAQNFRAGVVREKLFKRRVWKESLSKQDFEKNQEIDISTLKNFVIDKPEFYRKYKNYINKRISELYLKFGYMYLKHKKRNIASQKFLHSFIKYPSIKSIKGMISSIVPEIFLSYLQKNRNEHSRSIDANNQ